MARRCVGWMVRGDPGCDQSSCWLLLTSWEGGEESPASEGRNKDPCVLRSWPQGPAVGVFLGDQLGILLLLLVLLRTTMKGLGRGLRIVWGTGFSSFFVVAEYFKRVLLGKQCKEMMILITRAQVPFGEETLSHGRIPQGPLWVHVRPQGYDL